MAHFYTRMGDDGYTGLLGEGRIPKYALRPEAIGTIDEASAALGIVRVMCQAAQTGPLLLCVQRDLYNLMTELAATPENIERFHKIDINRVTWLEAQTDAITELVNLPGEFIVPGDSPAGAAMDLARTIVRRAERRVAQLLHAGEIENPELIHYLNRLSSLCFVVELLENQAVGKTYPTLAKEMKPNNY